MLHDESPLFEFRGPWGVPIQCGSTIVLLFLVVISLGRTASDLYYLYYDAIFFLILLGSIFLHELGHAWGCLVQGIPVRRIMLNGGGGFCVPDRPTTAREDELIVAMGPIVNLTLWALASLAAPIFEYRDAGWILATIAHVNLYLAIFNLVPVMPLDGGRLLHLALLRVVPSPVAVRIAGAVGLVFSVLWIPAMIVLYFAMGLFLVFFPPVGLHWRMFTRKPA